MPIKSYIAFPCLGKEKEFVTTLNEMPEVELIRSDDEKVYIVVTETATPELDKKVHAELENNSSIQCITLVSAFEDDIEIDEEELKKLTKEAAAQKISAVSEK